MHISDSYLHVPGYHPSFDSPTFFQQRVDDPSTLPSFHKHLWGRVLSLGNCTLQAEKKLHLRVVEGGRRRVDFGTDPLVLNGEGSNVMLEWSQPAVVMVAKVLEHCQKEYSSLFPSSSSSSPEKEGRGAGEKLPFPPVVMRLQLIGINAFLYGLTPGK